MFPIKHQTTLLSPKPSLPPNPPTKDRAGSKGRLRRAVLSEWHTDLLNLLITLGCWCPPVPTWGGGHGASGAGVKRCHFHPPSHPGRAGMAPNKTNLSIISLSLYKYRIYIYISLPIYIYRSSLSGKDKRLICLCMHDQSHQPPGTAGAEGRAPPPPAPLEPGGGHILRPQVIAGQVPSCSQTSRGGRSQRKEIPL